MRPEPNIRIEAYRVQHPVLGASPAGARWGCFNVRCVPEGKPSVALSTMNVIASDAGGWEHVSVSVLGEQRCPTWKEMAFVKDLWWEDEETVVQFHPAKSHYISRHPFVLHLWRQAGENWPLPPPEFV